MTRPRRRLPRDGTAFGEPVSVDVAIADFAAHIAYLDPRTGCGYLVAPQADSDVVLGDAQALDGLSLYAADRRYALDELAGDGWELFLDENGDIELAGRTPDGRIALCLHGLPTAGEPSLEALARALLALDIAAGLA